MNKPAWCREHDISDKLFFYWQRLLHEETYTSTIKSSSLPAVKSVSTSLFDRDFKRCFRGTDKQGSKFSYMLNDATGFDKIFIATGFSSRHFILIFSEYRDVYSLPRKKDEDNISYVIMESY